MRSKKTIYNVTTGFILQIIAIINGFIIPKIIINNFGSNVNGLVSSITQFLGYITLLESGFCPLVKSLLYKPIAKKDKEEIQNILKASEKFFKKISIIFAIYIILLSVFYPLIVNNSFGYIYTLSLIIIISISSFAEYYFGMTYKLYLQSNQETYIINIIQTLTYFINIFLIILLSKIGANIHVIKMTSCIIFIFRPIVQNYYVNKKYNINLKNIDSNYNIKNKSDAMAQHIAAVIHGNTDITLLTFFSNFKLVSIYSIYNLVITGVKSIISSLTSGIDSSFGDMIAKEENENLNKKYNLYEIIYLIIVTIFFSCTLVLINPFVEIYTKEIKDLNYVRQTFGYLIVIAEFFWAIRQPYNELVKAAGHFKETKSGAVVECISNIIISLILILILKNKLIAVAIGTIAAMLIRTFELINYSNKKILKRSPIYSFKKVTLNIIECFIIFTICKYCPFFKNGNYLNWIINAIITFIISSIVTILLTIICYKDNINDVINYCKNLISKKEKNK